MIFVTVGSMFPFDRLIISVDKWAQERSVDNITYQVGLGKYKPVNGRWFTSLPSQDYYTEMQKSTIVVSHLGMGTILAALKHRKPLIALPRRQDLSEVNTDHQLDGAEWLSSVSGVWLASDETALHALLDRYLSGLLRHDMETFSDHASVQLLDNIKKFLNTP